MRSRPSIRARFCSSVRRTACRKKSFPSGFFSAESASFKLLEGLIPRIDLYELGSR
jgi:hypothetical protein